MFVSKMKVNIPFLRRIYDSAKELNRKNALIKAKYDNDDIFINETLTANKYSLIIK